MICSFDWLVLEWLSCDLNYGSSQVLKRKLLLHSECSSDYHIDVGKGFRGIYIMLPSHSEGLKLIRLLLKDIRGNPSKRNCTLHSGMRSVNKRKS